MDQNQRNALVFAHPQIAETVAAGFDELRLRLIGFGRCGGIEARLEVLDKRVDVGIGHRGVGGDRKQGADRHGLGPHLSGAVSAHRRPATRRRS